MPAAGNTNNFWNLGEENRGFSRNDTAAIKGFVADYADSKGRGD
jgi:hypothetical protein